MPAYNSTRLHDIALLPGRTWSRVDTPNAGGFLVHTGAGQATSISVRTAVATRLTINTTQ